MSATALATLLILISAALHAAANALVKVSDDGLLTRGCMNATALVIALPCVAFVPFPSREVWWVLLASMLVHGLYPFFLVGAYRVGDLSAMLPLARGSAPLGVAALALLFAGEKLGIQQMLCVGLISLGIGMLAFERGVPAKGDARNSVGFALATGLIIAGYTVLDAIGVRKAMTPMSYIIWLFVLDGFFVAALVGWVRRASVVPFLKRNWKSSLLGGGLGVTTYGLALYALSLGSMVEIAALRETSVIFAAAIGAVLLGEPFGRWRILAASVVACGVIGLQLSASG